MVEFAPGLPSKHIKEVPRISEPQVWNLAIQKHDAKRAGTHYDLRLVDDKTGKAYSWAVKNLPSLPGDKTLAKLQPTHTSNYSTWSGTIESGYGAGNVALFQHEKTEITKADPDHITFNVYKSNGDTERFALIHTGGDDWLFHNVTVTRDTRPQIPSEKPSYKSIGIDKVETDNPNQILAPKIDGALNVFLLRRGKPIETYSYRPSKKGPSKLIDHTFRSGLYKFTTPQAFRGNTVLLGEVFARNRADENVLPSTETSSRLLSNVWRSRELQDKAPLDNIVFNILRYQGRDVSNKPYSEKLQLLKRITSSVPGLKMPPLAISPEQKKELVRQIIDKKHPMTSEGVVVYDLNSSVPMKAKIQEDYDVHVKDVFPGEGKYKGVGAGGFTYSHTPGGPVAGRVGSGFDDETRKRMLANPEEWRGHVARVWAQQKLPSGALRMPVFKDLRSEMWKKATIHILTGPMAAGKTTRAKQMAPEYDGVFNTDNPNRLLPGFVKSTPEESQARRLKLLDTIMEQHRQGKKILVEGTPGAMVKFPGLVENSEKIMLLQTPTIRRIRQLVSRAKERGVSILDDLRASHTFNKRGKIITKYWEVMYPDKFTKIAESKKPTLLPYQEELKQKLQNRHGAIVTWGLGSGKTIGAIAAADQFGDAKAVVPASLRNNFKKELKTFKPKNKFDVESYEKFVKNPDVSDKTVIFDEAHRLRTAGSKRSQVAQALSSQARKAILLTGTPIQNAPHEIAPLINIAAGGHVLPTNEKEFNKRYLKRVVDNPGIIRRFLFNAKPKDEYHINNVKDFEARIKPYVVNNVGYKNKDLPEVTHHNVDIEMSRMQSKVYKTMEANLPGRVRKKIESSLPAEKKDIGRLNAFLSSTRQVSNTGDKFYKDNEKSYSPKFDKIVENIGANKGKALIYSNYLESGVNPLSEMLTKRNIPHATFTGQLGDRDRKKIIDSYNKDKIRALIVSSSGAEGLDLKGTRSVHITEPHWNEAKIDQVIGRSARLGSHTHLPENERKVDVYRYRSVLPEKRHGFLWLKKGRPISADQYLDNMSKKKTELNNEFLSIVKRAEQYMSTTPKTQNIYEDVPASLIEETDLAPNANRNPHLFKELLKKRGLTITPNNGKI